MTADTWVSSSDLHQCLNIHVPSSPSREDCRDMNEHLQADRRPEPPSLDDAKPRGALTCLGCPLDPRVSKHERVTDVYTGLATFIHHLLKGHNGNQHHGEVRDLSKQARPLSTPCRPVVPCQACEALTLSDRHQDQ